MSRNRPHRRHPGLGDGQAQRAFHEQGGGPGGQGGRGEVMAVGGRAHDATEEVAGGDGPAVVGDRRDLGARISPQLEHVDGVEELVEQHSGYVALSA